MVFQQTQPEMNMLLFQMSTCLLPLHLAVASSDTIVMQMAVVLAAKAMEGAAMTTRTVHLLCQFQQGHHLIHLLLPLQDQQE